jgi:hypothetical protein
MSKKYPNLGIKKKGRYAPKYRNRLAIPLFGKVKNYVHNIIRSNFLDLGSISVVDKVK